MSLSRLFRFAAVLLVPALLSNGLAFAAKKPVDPEVMKAKIQTHGVGEGVRVTLADNTETRGLIIAIGDQSFTLKPRKTPDVRQIEFAQVTSVHRDHLSTGQKVGIGVGIFAAGVATTATVLAYKLRGWY